MSVEKSKSDAQSINSLGLGILITVATNFLFLATSFIVKEYPLYGGELCLCKGALQVSLHAVVTRSMCPLMFSFPRLYSLDLLHVAFTIRSLQLSASLLMKRTRCYASSLPYMVLPMESWFCRATWPSR